MARYSKASYIEIATMLRMVFRSYVTSPSSATAMMADELTANLADIFAADNPLFDRDRFYAAVKKHS